MDSIYRNIIRGIHQDFLALINRPSVPMESKASWEERFDKDFPPQSLGHKHTEDCEWICILRPNIKAFIKSVVAEAIGGIELGRPTPQYPLDKYGQGCLDAWENATNLIEGQKAEIAKRYL